MCGADFTPYRNPDRVVVQGAMLLTEDQRYLQFAMVRTPEEMGGLLQALGAGHLLEDPRFATPEERLANGAALIALLTPIAASKSSREWSAIFTAARVPAQLVETLDDLLTDPQIRLNQIFAEPTEDVGVDRVVSPPVFVDGLPRTGIRKAPQIGEHSGEILATLGYSADEIETLRAQGVV